jgi:hypothetical protein
MKINQNKLAELEMSYDEICKKHYSTIIAQLPKLTVKIVDGEGKVEARNNLYRFMDYTVSKDGKVSLHHCDPFFHGFITEKSQPFENNILKD